MNIAILSDIHDNVPVLKQALLTDEVKTASHIICCGDLCSAFIIKILNQYSANQKIHIVFGNNDGDKFKMSMLSSEHKKINIYGDFLDILIDNRRIAVNHYPEIAKLVYESFNFDLVCYGHTHLYLCSFEKKSFLLNPGNMLGYNSITDSQTIITFAVYDTIDHKVCIHKLLETGKCSLIHTYNSQ